MASSRDGYRYADLDSDDIDHDLAISTLHMQIDDTVLISPSIERDSVYGLVFVIPQIARSARWSLKLKVMAVRSFTLHALNCGLQLLLVYMLKKEEMVMDKFAGQMFLCDFGSMLACRDGDGCQGPYGTPYSPSRLYSWDQIMQRTFVRDSLLALFPERSEDINAKVDPGEYGLEDYWCRLACVFVFTLSIMEELLNILRMVRVTYSVPTQPECWIKYTGSAELQQHSLRVKVAGMPLHWKVFNIIFVIVPKGLIWKFTAEAGTLFLMESAGIADVIVNAVALVFILNISQIIFTELTLRTTKDLLEGLEQFHFQKTETNISKEDLLDRYLARRSVCEAFQLLEARVLLAVLICVCTIYGYYCTACIKDEDGRYVSLDQYRPKSADLSLLSAWLPLIFPLDTEEEPYWSRPT